MVEQKTTISQIGLSFSFIPFVCTLLLYKTYTILKTGLNQSCYDYVKLQQIVCVYCDSAKKIPNFPQTTNR